MLPLEVGVSQELAPDDPPRIGPYRIVRRLGRGSMGQVFLGRSAGGRPVTVKVIRADLAADPGFLARFRRDVDAARKVTGLYTASLADADLDGPLPWLATAYVAGPSLAAAVADHGPLPAASVVMLAAGLAESLTSIHSAGVVHRDLKPSNVLLADDGPRVIDFGISQVAAPNGLTRAAFVSPEEAAGGQPSPASDVFSFGAVLTFAATGHPPFGDDSAGTLGRGALGRGALRPGAPCLDDVPAEIRALVARCLSEEPSQRPTAPELLAELADTDVSAAWLPEPVTGEVPRPALDSTAARPADGRQHHGHRGSRWCQAPPVLVGTLAGQMSSAVYAVAFSPRGDVLAAADGNGRVYLWDVVTGDLADSFADPASQGVIGVAFDPDGELLAAADGNGRLFLWDLVSGELARTFGRRRGPGVNGVASGLGGDVLAAADSSGQVCVWDVVTGDLTARFADPGSQGAMGVAFGPGGSVLAAADGNGRVSLWDVNSGVLVRVFAHPGSQGVNGVAFSPDGAVLAAADGNGRVSLWDVNSGVLVRVFAHPGSQGVNGVAFSPDGAVLAAADGNGYVCVWDMAGGALAGVFAGPGSQGVNGVAFSPDGELQAAADGNGRVYLWRASPAPSLPAAEASELT
jgi:DNA-binding beta-propeller fold protein YncE